MSTARLLILGSPEEEFLRVFQHSVEAIDLKGESSVDAEWMAYLGGFHYLQCLELADCRGVTDSALWAITGMTRLEVLDLSRCSKITDSGVGHILSLSNLKKLCISETGVTTAGIMRLSSLRHLSTLDLGGLLVTDKAISSFQALTQLEYLDLWGSNISNQGAAILKMFPKLNYLNIAWTKVTKLPNLPSLSYLNMSSCTIESIFGQDNEINSSLSKLLISGATFRNVSKAFSYLMSNLVYLDISSSPVDDFSFLDKMSGLEYLDLSSCKVNDNLIVWVASIGAHLRHLHLNNTTVSSVGLSFLANNVPKLETLSLSHTAIYDDVFSSISEMRSLKKLNMSNTTIRGFTLSGRVKTSSLAALLDLEHLESFDLKDTLIKDEWLHPLTFLRNLKSLSLKGDFLSDSSLHALSSLPKLKFLQFQGAVLTNTALIFFNPPPSLQILDLRECWLLTEDAISAFHRYYPQIEVQHELAVNLHKDQNVIHSSFSSRRTSTTIKSSPNDCQNKCFADERIKYSREEMLQLQFSSVTKKQALRTSGQADIV